MTISASARTAPTSASASPLKLVKIAPYMITPCDLAERFRRNPHIIGIYELVARRYGIDRVAVPLAPSDIVLFDPTLTIEQARRGLTELVTAGYLVAERCGRKMAYRPAWGKINKQTRPWRLDQPQLGRPNHIHCFKVDARLLDIYIGRLRPDPMFPALVRRYISIPLLTLADVGHYALIKAGLPAHNDRLTQLNLVGGGRAQLPPSPRQIVAAAMDVGHTLLPAGERLLGLATPEYDLDLGADIERDLGPEDGPDVGQFRNTKYQENIAPQSRKVRQAPIETAVSWMSMQNMESHGDPPPTPPKGAGGGGRLRFVEKELPDTPMVRELKARHANPKTIQTLALCPVEWLYAALAYTETCNNLADPFAVALSIVLDKAADPSYVIPPPRPRPGFIDYEAFRRTLDATYTDVPVLEDMPPAEDAEATGCKSFDVPALGSCTPGPDPDRADLDHGRIDSTALQCSDVEIASEVLSEAAEKKPLHQQPTGRDLSAALTSELRSLIPHRYHAALVGLRVHLVSDQVSIVCPSAAQRETLSSHSLCDALSAALVTLGLPTQPKLVFTPASPSVAPVEDIQASRPSWIAPEQWAVLPSMLRSLLCGSSLENGQLVALSVFAQRKIENCFAAELAMLQRSEAHATS